MPHESEFEADNNPNKFVPTPLDGGHVRTHLIGNHRIKYAYTGVKAASEAPNADRARRAGIIESVCTNCGAYDEDGFSHNCLCDACHTKVFGKPLNKVHEMHLAEDVLASFTRRTEGWGARIKRIFRFWKV